MTLLLIVSLSINALAVWALIMVTMRTVELSEKFEEVEEFLEESYERILRSHDFLKEKSNTELFSDEPVVKEVVAEIYEAKNSLHVVLDALQEYSKKPVEGSMDEKQKDK